MAPEPATLLPAEPAAEPAADVALPTMPWDEVPLLEDEPPVVEEELPELVPEELELELPLPVLEALEPEEVAELPPVMLLRMEPVRLSISGNDEYGFIGSLTWGVGGAREDGAFEHVSQWTDYDRCFGLLMALPNAYLRW
jgi:hypothetical protein